MLKLLPTSRLASFGLRQAARQYSAITYDGTQSSIINSNSLYKDSYRRDIPTVELEYDLFEAPNPSQNNPIVFIHGLFGSKMNNRSVSKQLCKLLNRDIYNIDLRNHGDSPHIERHDYPAMSHDLEMFIQEMDLLDPILIGHSMGAKVAMATCLRNPSLISMLISVDNAPVDTTTYISNNKFKTYLQKLREIVNDSSVNSIKKADERLSAVEESLPIRQFLLTNIKHNRETNRLESRIPLETMIKALPNVSQFPFDSQLSTFKKPSLFIRGKQSKYIADEFVTPIGQFFPQFELKDVDAGHWLIAEKPKEFIELVVEYIERKEDV